MWGRGEEWERVGGKHKLARYSVYSKQPNALLKIFPLRACSFLNVVIMQKCFPPSLPPLPPSLPAAHINCCRRNIWEPGREPHTAVPIDHSQRSGRQPFLPRAGHTLRIFLGPQDSPAGLPLSPGQWEAAPIQIMLMSQSLTENEPCFLVQFY